MRIMNIRCIENTNFTKTRLLFAYLQNLSKTGIKLLREHFLHKHTMGKPTILVEYKKLQCSSS